MLFLIASYNKCLTTRITRSTSTTFSLLLVLVNGGEERFSVISNFITNIFNCVESLTGLEHFVFKLMNWRIIVLVLNKTPFKTLTLGSKLYLVLTWYHIPGFNSSLETRSQKIRVNTRWKQGLRVSVSPFILLTLTWPTTMATETISKQSLWMPHSEQRQYRQKSTQSALTPQRHLTHRDVNPSDLAVQRHNRVSFTTITDKNLRCRAACTWPPETAGISWLLTDAAHYRKREIGNMVSVFWVFLQSKANWDENIYICLQIGHFLFYNSTPLSDVKSHLTILRSGHSLLDLI